MIEMTNFYRIPNASQMRPPTCAAPNPFPTSPTKSASPASATRATNPFNPFPESVDSNPFNPLPTSPTKSASPAGATRATNPFNPLPESVDSNPFNPFPESVDSNPFPTPQPTITWDARGLVPVVVQDATTGDVLMLAYANAEAVQRTVDTGEAWFWSRSRSELWHKGATSGNVQQVIEVRIDCDGDTLLYRVLPAGPACHTGERSCFYRTLYLTP
jgi:phosphoribosyl-AMP cyclohydrolase